MWLVVMTKNKFISKETFALTFYFTGLSSDNILAIFRNWKNKTMTQDVEKVKSVLKNRLPSENHSTLE